MSDRVILNLGDAPGDDLTVDDVLARMSPEDRAELDLALGIIGRTLIGDADVVFDLPADSTDEAA